VRTRAGGNTTGRAPGRVALKLPAGSNGPPVEARRLGRALMGRGPLEGGLGSERWTSVDGRRAEVGWGDRFELIGRPGVAGWGDRSNSKEDEIYFRPRTRRAAGSGEWSWARRVTRFEWAPVLLPARWSARLWRARDGDFWR